MEKRSVGFIETVGLASAIEAADAAVKSAKVTLLGYEYSGYDARVVVKIEGKISDIRVAIDAAARATQKIQGSLKGYDCKRIWPWIFQKQSCRDAEVLSDI